MKKYTVTGMSCAACSARVEKAVGAADSVTECSVNLLTNTLIVNDTANEGEIIAAVTAAGYGIADTEKKDAPAKDKEARAILLRFVISVLLVLVLMLFSMGRMLGININIPPLSNALIQLALALAVMIINKKFFVSGTSSLLAGAPNMDTLVCIGSGASFVYSAVKTLLMIGADSESAQAALHDLYFESAAMILALITLGKMLESYSKGKTTSALKSLMDLAPKTAVIIVDGKEKTVPATDVRIGDTLVIYPGAAVPVDCEIISGETSCDESALTGESMPSDKKVGDSLFVSTINLSGNVTCRATGVGEDTTLAGIIRMVSDAAATKAPISRLADKVSGIFVPVVIAIAAITFAAWMLIGKDIGFSLARAISVLVISCPCALGLATPVAIMVGSGVGAKNNILFKTAAALESAGKIKTVVLDKTGTVTNGRPIVTDVVTASGTDERELLSLAAALESRSEHPLGASVTEYVDFDYEKADTATVLAGSGIFGTVSGEKVYGGNRKYISGVAEIPCEILEKSDELSKQGKTLLYFAKDDKLLGVIAVADTVKADSAFAVKKLKKLGIDVVMLTGDNQTTAEAIAKQVGIEKVIAGVLPSEKAEHIKTLSQNSVTAMVGDGINDAPALTAAQVGIAIGAGTDIAIDSADIVLMNSSLEGVFTAIKLGKSVLSNIRENLFWAFFYNMIGIPIAAGVFIDLFGWQLSPMLGAAAMSLSSFCVVSNALRLNFFKIKKETKNMTVTLNIEGMMCPHCENRVKTTLEGLPQVEKAEVSHKTGTAKVTLSKDTDTDVLVKAVEAQGYKVK